MKIAQYLAIVFFVSSSQLFLASDNEKAILNRLDSIESKLPSTTKKVVWYAGVTTAIGISVYSIWKWCDFYTQKNLEDDLAKLSEEHKQQSFTFIEKSKKQSIHRQNFFNAKLIELNSNNNKNLTINNNAIDGISSAINSITGQSANQYNDLYNIQSTLEQEVNNLEKNGENIFNTNNTILSTNKAIELSTQNTQQFNIQTNNVLGKSEIFNQKINSHGKNIEEFDKMAKNKVNTMDQYNIDTNKFIQDNRYFNRTNESFIKNLENNQNKVTHN